MNEITSEVDVTTSPTATCQFVVACKGASHDLALPLDVSIGALRQHVEDITSVPVAHQKIMAPMGPLRAVFSTGGKSSDEDGEKTLFQIGIPPNQLIKIMVVGPTTKEIDSIRKEDEQAEKANAPRQYHSSMLRGSRPRTTGGTSSLAQNPFRSLKVHNSTPSSSPTYNLVHSRLSKLANDPAVIHVCALHQFSIGELTELLPHEHPGLLGLNENMGMRISLRIRTDDYEGLREYKTTRRVLLHELAHNQVNDVSRWNQVQNTSIRFDADLFPLLSPQHPPEFKILNSELNAQMEAFERDKLNGTHSLIDSDVYEPPEPSGAEEPAAYVLGGVGSKGPEDRNNRRQRILMATMKRLEKAEADIERGCGSGS